MTIEPTPQSTARHTGAGEAAGASANGVAAGGWLSALRSRLMRSQGATLRTTLEDAVKAAGDEQTMGAEEREMLLRLLTFGALRVDDVMVPRADIIALDEHATVRELLRTFDQAGVSRMPLYHETLDDPRGMVHTKDLMRWMMGGALGRPAIEGRIGAAGAAGPRAAAFDAAAAASQRAHAETEPSLDAPIDFAKLDLSRSIASAKLRRPVLYVPPSMPAMNLLIRMQTTRNHMALVVDEYGGTDGLVTIEDLVEQIVGDIEDEHDEAEAANIVADPKLGLIAAARTPVRELEEYLGIELLKPGEEENIDTLGGLVFQIVGRVPARGEIVRHSSGVEFEVLDADPRRVKKLKIHRPKVGGLATESATAGSKE